MQSRLIHCIGILQLIRVIQSPEFVHCQKTSKYAMGNCKSNGCGSGIKNWLKKEEKKMEHALDPTNQEVVEYCKSLIGVGFQGETSNKSDEVTDHTEDQHAINLGSVLQSMDVEIREKGDKFNGTEDRFLEYLEMAITYRKQNHMDMTQFREKIMNDKEKFVQHLRNRKGSASVSQLHLKHQTYWGTRQQLRSAKVVGDWIDKEYGPIDPIFGVLLNPTGGRTGPGDSSFLHDEFFDNSGEIAYHSAVHDAFGYLINSHDTGPGYKYLGAPSVFDTKNPLSEQVAGITFWKKTLEMRNDTNTEHRTL